MFVAIMMGAFTWFAMFWGLRALGADEYHAKAIPTALFVGAAVALLSMAVGMLFVPVFGDYGWFKELCMDQSIWKGYESWVEAKGKHPAFFWHLITPYVAVFQFIVWYFDILIHHFKFHFIFTHGAGLYIMYVYCSFFFDLNHSLMDPDKRFGIKRDANGNIIQ